MKTRIIVSALLEKEGKLLLQTRHKTQTSPLYSGLLEIPAGGVDEFEDVYVAIKREVREETNLEITNFFNDWQSTIYENLKGEQS